MNLMPLIPYADWMVSITYFEGKSIRNIQDRCWNRTTHIRFYKTINYTIMMNLFYYMYYRLENFCRRHQESDPSFSAYCALFFIEVLTLYLLCLICGKVFNSHISMGDWILSNRIFVAFFGVGLFSIQSQKVKKIDKNLKRKWSKEPSKQQRVRKYLLVSYVVLVVVLILLLSCL